MTDHGTERAAIRDAMTRLLDGAPIRSDGKLTIKSLADEAGVKRWLLTHRHTDLQAEFRDRIATHGQDPEPVQRLKQEVRELHEENKRLRENLREAKAIASMLERHIAVDALEQLRQRSSIDKPARLRAIPTSPDPRT
jgi:predicted RNase H-like nuclease (RuvC/YqgF family)